MKKLILALGLVACQVWADAPVTLSFTQPDLQWKGNPRAVLDATQPQDLQVSITGEDPWIESTYFPVHFSDKVKKIAVRLEAETDNDGTCQLFYAAPNQAFSETRMATLKQTGKGIYTGEIVFSAASLRLRIDPPGDRGCALFKRLALLPRIPLAQPPLTPSSFFQLSSPLATACGPLGILAQGYAFGRWTYTQNGRVVARGNAEEKLLYLDRKDAVAELAWGAQRVCVQPCTNGYCAAFTATDRDGVLWTVKRTVEAQPHGITIATTVEVSQERKVVFLPWLTLFAGEATCGTNKTQALLPGIEYLANEPSSNEKEIRGLAANRRFAEPYKVCYPLMAIGADNQWFALTWQKDACVQQVFDSPDRLFATAGHLMGLWLPTVSVSETGLDIYSTVTFKAGTLYRATACMLTGRGDVMTEPIARYIQIHALPALPVRNEEHFDAAIRLMAAGWLDSAAKEGTKFRHAVWGSSFGAAQAEDVPAYLQWLAAHARDPRLKQRLHETSAEVIAALPPGALGAWGISHIRRPTGALLYGQLEALIKHARHQVVQLAASMPDGKLIYRPGKVDFASTLGCDHCNGYSAMRSEDMLLNATLIGDEAAIEKALSVLDKMTGLYTGSVPCGAQPWEMPLHTPDIVASARLIRCYVLGYLLSGRETYLEQARYWAWTGLSMVYLTQPTAGEIGLYGTIGVIGATQWIAPNWIGQPVQWCGLVYRSALEDLVRVDTTSARHVWTQVAHGITLTGLQMTFPIGDPKQRGGLLPDYFLLNEQMRDGPAINPGTLQAHLGEPFGKLPHYTVTRLHSGALIHVVGDVIPFADQAVHVNVRSWAEQHRLVVTRLSAPRAVRWNQKPVAFTYLQDERVLIVPVTGSGELNVEITPQ